MKSHTPKPIAAAHSKTRPSCSGNTAGLLGAIVFRRSLDHMSDLRLEVEVGHQNAGQDVPRR